MVLGLGLSLTAWGAPDATPANGEPLVVVSDANYPPITYLDGGSPKGMAVDILHALAVRLGRPMEIRLMAWQEAQDMVLRGDAGALFPMSIIEARQQAFDFSDPVLELKYSIFAGTGRTGISGLADLEGLRVGVTSGGLPRQLLENRPRVQLVTIADYPRGFQLLKAGELDAVVADNWVGSFVLAENNIRNVRITGDPVARLQAAVAVRKGQAAILPAVNTALRAMQADGTIDRITRNWEPKEVVFLTREQIWRWGIGGAFGLLVLLLAAVLLWVRGLRREVVERRQADSQIVTLNQRLSLATRSAGIGIWDWDAERRVLVWDDEMYRIYQATRGGPDAAQTAWNNALHPTDRERVEKEVETALQNQRHLHSEFRITRPDGAVRTIRSSAEIFRNKDGRLLRMVGVNYDITERNAVAEELRFRTAFFEAQVDSALDGILVVDSTGKKVLQNRRLGEVWKVPQEVLDDPDDAKQVQYVTGRTKNPKQFAEKVAYLYSHPTEVSRDVIELVDGTVLDRYSAPVRDARGRHYGRIWTFRDITEQRRLEEQLRQSQKMEAIGQLSGGVAHDFNNLLTVIKGHIGLLRITGQLPPDTVDSINQIDGAANRAVKLTTQLLTFSRQQVMQTARLDLNGLVLNLTKMLRRLLSENIEMVVECAPQPLLIQADEGMVEQVLLNLVVNARDAMTKTGTLRVNTAAVDLDEAAAHHLAQARPGAFVCLAVSDTGTGIAPEVLPHIFEPFYTTKEVGKGTGLGLATVYGVMQQHGGWVSVESTVGRGTEFRVYFPRVAATADPGSPAAPTQTAVRGGHEGILLVEDEPAVRKVAESALTGLGYRVMTAPSGLAALQVWAAHKHEIDLLLTDLVMPDGVNGRELALQLRESNPALPVVYMSGYSREVAGGDFTLQEGTNYLPKPFELTTLAKIVRASLDRGVTQAPFTNPPG